jgi:hypothetical protein
MSVIGAAACAWVSLLATCAAAQPIPIRDFAPVNVGQAIARENLRTISQLPPVTNLSFVYKYDPAIDSYVSQRDDLGSGMVVASRFNRKGGFALMFSFAYYRLDQFDGKDSVALVVNVPTDRFNPASPRVDIGIAARTTADVTVSRFSGRYSILDNWDVGLSVPLVSVDVQSRYKVQALSGPGAVQDFVAGGVATPDRGGNTLLDTQLNRLDLPDGFREGQNLDVGNIDLDSKVGLDSGVPGLNLGVQANLRLPTANESRFTGVESTSIRGLLLADYHVRNFGFYFNGGYDHDFGDKFMSNAQVSGSVTLKPHRLVILETGIQANFYDSAVDVFDSGALARTQPGTVIVAGGSALGKNEVNIGGGVRFAPIGDLSVSAYVSAPLNDAGYRADGIFSLALDYPL